MRELIKKILHEQDIPDENVVHGQQYPDYEKWGDMSKEEKETEGMPYKTHQMDKNIFFKIIKHLVESSSKEWFVDKVRGEEGESVSEKLYELKNTFKLFGQTDQTMGYFTSDSLAAKIFYLAHDNWDGIKQGHFTKLEDLKFRSIKIFEVDCNESVIEHISYTWTVELEAYTREDAESEVIMNDDGIYSWWEWDNKPGFDREEYDSNSDGMEVDDTREVTSEGKAVESLGEHKIIKEVSDGGLVSGLKNILKKWKASRTENRWYDEIEDLLKKEKLNEGKKSNKIDEEYVAPETPRDVANKHTVTPVYLKIMKTLSETLGFDKIVHMLTQPLDDITVSTYSIFKLYGVTDPDTYHLGKQLIQFMVDNKDDYWEEKHIGVPLPTLHTFSFTKSWIENERVEKEGVVQLTDTNFESASCAVNQEFWEYSPDEESVDVLDSEFEGDEEWTNVWMDNKEVWRQTGRMGGISQAGVTGYSDKFNPNNSKCEEK